MNKTILISAVLIIVVGAGAFFAGMQYQKSQRGSFFISGGQGGNMGFRRFGNGNNANRPVIGQIVNATNDTIVVKMNDGSTKNVDISGNTSISKAAQGSKSDLTTGTMVAVFGQDNSDGSVTAQNVQINPMMRVFENKNGATPSAQ